MVNYSTGEFLDFRLIFHISAFLFAGLIFLVTFLHQGKKVKGTLFRMEFQTYKVNFYFTKKQDELEAYKSSGSNFYSRAFNDIQPTIFV